MMTRGFYALNVVFFSIPTPEGFWPQFGEKLTLIASLSFFLYYFMKELKELRVQYEKSRQEHEQKFERLLERVLNFETEAAKNMRNLTDSIDTLCEKIEKLRP